MQGLGHEDGFGPTKSQLAAVFEAGLPNVRTTAELITDLTQARGMLPVSQNSPAGAFTGSLIASVSLQAGPSTALPVCKGPKGSRSALRQSRDAGYSGKQIAEASK
ncbi:hypothetical protein WJX84_009651 [Apatococcus fuscideae]|uniref:Uncharacterized protein n=1 Tax=Apatococcus fuscideae TaxID=2026836 RepID=A0AAW1TAB5_9CHLO